ncbi:MAG: hypothetical protein GY822_06490 [Deltaproteobacteria bacterium]|nr:hypothetical protein [Deltaproteobacteria bacterium]
MRQWNLPDYTFGLSGVSGFCFIAACNAETGCIAVTNPEACDDDDSCTLDLCDEIVGCSHQLQPDGTPCAPVDGCTINICSVGVCVPIVLPDDTPCSDGDFCTTDDRCLDAICIGSETQTAPAPVGSTYSYGAQASAVGSLSENRLVFVDRGRIHSDFTDGLFVSIVDVIEEELILQKATEINISNLDGGSELFVRAIGEQRFLLAYRNELFTFSVGVDGDVILEGGVEWELPDGAWTNAPDTPITIEVFNDVVYLFSYLGLYVIDVQTPGSATLLHVELMSTQANDFVIDSTRGELLLAEGTVVKRLDLSEPSSFFPLPDVFDIRMSQPSEPTIYALALQNDLLAILTRESIELVDVVTGESVEVLSYLEFSVTISDVEFLQGALLVAGHSGISSPEVRSFSVDDRSDVRETRRTVFPVFMPLPNSPSYSSNRMHVGAGHLLLGGNRSGASSVVLALDVGQTPAAHFISGVGHGGFERIHMGPAGTFITSLNAAHEFVLPAVYEPRTISGGQLPLSHLGKLVDVGLQVLPIASQQGRDKVGTLWGDHVQYDQYNDGHATLVGDIEGFGSFVVVNGRGLVSFRGTDDVIFVDSYNVSTGLAGPTVSLTAEDSYSLPATDGINFSFVAFAAQEDEVYACIYGPESSRLVLFDVTPVISVLADTELSNFYCSSGFANGENVALFQKGNETPGRLLSLRISEGAFVTMADSSAAGQELLFFDGEHALLNRHEASHILTSSMMNSSRLGLSPRFNLHLAFALKTTILSSSNKAS